MSAIAAAIPAPNQKDLHTKAFETTVRHMSKATPPGSGLAHLANLLLVCQSIKSSAMQYLNVDCTQPPKSKKTKLLDVQIEDATDSDASTIAASTGEDASSPRVLSDTDTMSNVDRSDVHELDDFHVESMSAVSQRIADILRKQQGSGEKENEDFGEDDYDLESLSALQSRIANVLRSELVSELEDSKNKYEIECMSDLQSRIANVLRSELESDEEDELDFKDHEDYNINNMTAVQFRIADAFREALDEEEVEEHEEDNDGYDADDEDPADLEEDITPKSKKLGRDAQIMNAQIMDFWVKSGRFWVKDL